MVVFGGSFVCSLILDVGIVLRRSVGFFCVVMGFDNFMCL